jgi:hypothetical protein
MIGVETAITLDRFKYRVTHDRSVGLPTKAAPSARDGRGAPVWGIPEEDACHQRGLCQVGEVPTGDGSDLPPLKSADASQLAHSLVSIYKKASANSVPSVVDESAIYVSHLSTNLVNAKNFEVSEWDTLVPYIGFLSQTPKPVSIARDWVVRSALGDLYDPDVLEDEEEGEDLCNCQFSLTYGAKILLNTATLHLKHTERPTSVPSIVFDAVDLLINMRGVGWSWPSQPFPRNGILPPSITIVLFKLLMKLTVFDATHYAIQHLRPPTNDPNGGSIFDPNLPFVPRAALAAFCSICCSVCAYAVIDFTYHCATLVGRIVFRQPASVWPRLFY